MKSISIFFLTIAMSLLSNAQHWTHYQPISEKHLVGYNYYNINEDLYIISAYDLLKYNHDLAIWQRQNLPTTYSFAIKLFEDKLILGKNNDLLYKHKITGVSYKINDSWKFYTFHKNINSGTSYNNVCYDTISNFYFLQKYDNILYATDGNHLDSIAADELTEGNILAIDNSIFSDDKYFYALLDNSNSIQFSKNNLSNFTIIDNSEFKDSLKSIIFISDDFKSERYILDSEKALYTIKDGKLIFRERFIVDSTTFDQRRVIVSTPTRSDTSDIKPIIFCKSNKNIEAILFDAHPKLLYPFSYIFIRENNNTLKRLYLPGFEDIKEVSLHPKVNSIQFDKDGRLWILTSRHGTYVYDPE